MFKNIKEKKSKELLEFLSEGSDWSYSENENGTVTEYQMLGNRKKVTNTFKNFKDALLSWKNDEKEQLVVYENIYLKEYDYMLLGLTKEYKKIYNKLNNIDNQRETCPNNCRYDIYEDNTLIERTVTFERIKERCTTLSYMCLDNQEESDLASIQYWKDKVAQILELNESEYSLELMQELFTQWNESIVVIDMATRKELFDVLKNDLIDDIKEIMTINIESITKLRNYNNSIISNLENWKITANEINNLECNNEGYFYLIDYFEQRGFESYWLENLNKVFNESRVNVYENSIDELTI